MLTLLTLALGPLGHAEDCFDGCFFDPPPGDIVVNPNDPIANQNCQCASNFTLGLGLPPKSTTGIGPTPGEACPQACAEDFPVDAFWWVPLTRSCSGVTPDGTRALSASERIVQCNWGFEGLLFQDAFIAELDNLVAREQQAVDQVLDLHLLPESDRGKVMGYARDSVRAVLFADLLGIIDQPDPRTEVEQGLVDVYAELVRQKRLIAAEFALSEYERWELVVCDNNGFGYVPPLGFTYPSQGGACGGIGGLFAGPIPPSSEEFIAYGTAHAYDRLSTDAQTVAVAARTARAAGLAGAVVGAGAAGVATALVVFNTALGPILVQALFPYALWSTWVPTAAMSGSSIAGGVVVSSVAAIGFVISVVILAIAISVLQGIAVFEAEQIPGELQARVEAAQVAPDLRASIQTPEGLQELYAVFIESTMPDYPATEPPPAPVGSDPRFRVQDETGQHLGVFPVIKLHSPSQPGNWQMRLSGGWFVPTYTDDGTASEELTLDVTYFDWEGTQRVAWRRGDQFVITNPDATGPDDAGEIVDEIRYKDWDGNKRIASITAGDETPPVITPAITGTRGTNDWYRSDVQVSWGVEDPESDIQSSSGCDPRSITSDGVSAFSCTATSDGGTSSESLTIKRDATLPVIQDDRDLIPNAAGWNNADVTISFTCDDALSGIAACSGPQTVASEGANQPVTGSATDDAGNTATRTVSVSLDKTAPRIRDSRMLAPNAAGWYRSDVTVVFLCDDALSGVASCSAPQTLSSEGENQSVSGSATDRAGNTASSTVSGISLDKTPPLVAVTGVSDAAVYTLGAVPAAGCSTSDGLSGVATEASIAVSGGNDRGVGDFTASCAGAVDLAGNSAAASASYQVVYPFGGFDGPIASPPGVNRVKAGASVPVKFSLGGDFGRDVLAAGSPASRPIACDFAEPATGELEPTATAGRSGLRYDPASGEYSYGWKTSKAWSGTCRELVLTLDDGTARRALFRFR